MDIDIIHSCGLPVDETRVQYIISAVGALEDIKDKSKDTAGLQSQGSSKKSQEPKAQYSSRQKLVNVDNVEASSSKKALEVSV